MKIIKILASIFVLNLAVRTLKQLVLASKTADMQISEIPEEQNVFINTLKSYGLTKIEVFYLLNKMAEYERTKSK